MNGAETASMKTHVRIGLIGSGFAAHFHLASYRKVYGESFEVAAICGRNAAQVTALADQFNVKHRYSNIEELIADPAIDLIDICVPNHLHADLILRCSQHGKHMICEKPLTGFFGPPDAGVDWTAKNASRTEMLDAVWQQARQISNSLETSGTTLCNAENWVYAPPIAKLNRLLAASNSTILRIDGEESHSGSHGAYSRTWRTAGGGSLLRLGVHPIGAAIFLKYEEGRRRNGKPIRPSAVQAQVGNLTEIASFRKEEPKHIVTGWFDVEDWSTMVLTFDDGSVAQLTASDVRMGGICNYLTAIGSRAVVTANINPNTTCQAYTPDGRYFESEYLVEKTETKAGWSSPAPDEDAVTGYPEELRDFIGAVSEGRAPKSNLMLATDVLIAVYAGYVSAQQGCRIDVSGYRN
jgi:predicted dehydrogenase